MNEKDSGSCQESVLLKCPAKLNLGLRITGKRSDGYHELQSLFWPISLEDDLELFEDEGRRGDSIKWAGDALRRDELPPVHSNIARAALNRIKNGERYSIGITKRIPIGGGLGGGSSNAGTLIRHFLREKSLANQIARNLGADVPFFLNPKPSWIEGVGDVIQPLLVEDSLQKAISFLVVVPNFSLVTKDVFQEHNRRRFEFSRPASKFEGGRITFDNFSSYLEQTSNDLTDSAIAIQPQLGEILGEIGKLNSDFFGMTGSGSTCFAIWYTKKPPTIKELTHSFRNHRCRVSIVKSHVE